MMARANAGRISSQRALLQSSSSQLSSRLRCPVRPAVCARTKATLLCIRAKQQEVHLQQAEEQQQPCSIPPAEQHPKTAVQQLTASSLAIAASCAGSGLLQPAVALAAEAATDAQHNMYLASVGLGTVFTVVTLMSTSRFMMSFFPKLEKQARMKSLPWSLFTIFDPLLQPIQRGLFKMEPGDIDYSSVAFLATVSSVMSTLVGRGGLMVELVPDASVLHYMQYLCFFQHGLLLPTWVLVVLRAFSVI